MKTKAEMLKELRAAAKNLNMTFREQNNYINSQQAYEIVDRKTKRVLSSNHTLSSAYSLENDYGLVVLLREQNIF